MFRALALVISVVLTVLGLSASAVSVASADACDLGSIIPAENSFNFSTQPFCDGEAVIVPAFPGAPYGYTTPGNTPFVNGQPQIGPYSNISTYTPAQAAQQRANGNASATSNAYNQYGGFTPPGQTATQETSPSYIVHP